MLSLIRRKPWHKKPLRRTLSLVRPRLEALEDRCLLSAPGTLDTTFGNGGTVTTVVTKGNDQAYGALLQPNGDIIAYGIASTNSGNLGLVRYTPSGSLDTTFGSGGIVTRSTHDFDPGNAVLQSDGKIVILCGSSNSSGWSLVRYNTNGSLDKTFGQRGVVTLPSAASWSGAVLLQPMSNGSEDIVVAGSGNSASNANDIVLARYTPSGQLDTTFGTGGETMTNIGGGFSNPNSLALENGDIVVGGDSTYGGTHGYLLARYTADGSLDTTFNPNGSQPGIVATQIGTGALDTALRSLLVQSDGKIVAVGLATDLVNSVTTDAWGLVRYNTDGSLDSTFGNGGIVLSNITSADNAIGSALQSNGEIVVAGWSESSPNQFEVGTYNTDGSPDTSFGTGGFVVQSFNSGSAAYGVAIQPADGKLVVAGSTTLSNGKKDFLVARYIGTTTPTNTPALAPALKRVENPSQSTPLALPPSTPAPGGSSLLTDSALPSLTSASLVPVTPANSTSGSSPGTSGWSAFQATMLGTLEQDLSQWENALMQTVDQLFTDWDQVVLDSSGVKPSLVG